MKAWGARLFALPVTAFAGLVSSHLIVTHYGAREFGYYGLLVSLVGVLAVGDLGVGAAINNVIAGGSERDRLGELQRAALTAVRTLVTSGLLVSVAGLVLSYFGVWPRLLGVPNTANANVAAGVCCALFGLGIPLGLGQRLLIAGGRSHEAVLIQVVQPIVTVVLLLLSRVADVDGYYLAAASYLGLLVAGLVSVARAKMVFPETVRYCIGSVFRLRSTRGSIIRDTALPMFLIMVCANLSLQTDRLVISHVRGAMEVAQFTLGSQFAMPLVALISTGSAAIWPIAAARRRNGEDSVSGSLVFAVAVPTVALGAAFVALAPWAGSLLSNGEIILSTELCLAFATFLLVQSIQGPLGNMISDSEGLRFQARCLAAALPLNLLCSILLCIRLGASGPLWGTAIATLLAQVIPELIYLRARRGRAAAGSGRRKVECAGIE